MGSLSFPKVLVIIIFAIPLFTFNVALMIVSILTMIAINRKNKSNKDEIEDEESGDAIGDETGDEESGEISDETGDETGDATTNTTGGVVQENFTQNNKFDIKNKTWFYLIPIFWSIIGMIASICLILLINQIPSNTQWKEHVMEEYIRTKNDATYQTDYKTLFDKITSDKTDTQTETIKPKILSSKRNTI